MSGGERISTVDHALDIVRRLDPPGCRAVLAELSKECELWWQETAARGEVDMVGLARARGRDWNVMTEAEREAFVDDLLHQSD